MKNDVEQACYYLIVAQCLAYLMYSDAQSGGLDPRNKGEYEAKMADINATSLSDLDVFFSYWYRDTFSPPLVKELSDTSGLKCRVSFLTNEEYREYEEDIIGDEYESFDDLYNFLMYKAERYIDLFWKGHGGCRFAPIPMPYQKACKKIKDLIEKANPILLRLKDKNRESKMTLQQMCALHNCIDDVEDTGMLISETYEVSDMVRDNLRTIKNIKYGTDHLYV